MSRLFRFIVFISGLLVAACSEQDLKSISLSRIALELQEGETFQLTIQSEPDDASVYVQWTSSDTTVASVSENGLVRALNDGSATITATSRNNIRASCVVLVKMPELTDALSILPKSAKRGVSYNFTIESDVELLSPYISWSYNWGADVTDNFGELFSRYNLDFCPMAWNGAYDADRIRAYKALHPECTYLLAFNEPNLIDQCNYTPQQAAEHWSDLKALADELNMKIVSPAMNYGTLDGYSDPIVWLDEFFTLVPPDDVAAIAIHCYMGTAAALKSYTERFYKYGKPIWMTEFCAWENNISGVQAQMNFMSEAISYLELDPMVERYAWFIPRSSGAVDSYPYMQLLTKNLPSELSELGLVFAGLSSFDKTLWQSTNSYILPNTYTAICSQESIGESGWIAGPHLQPTTDVTGTLQLTDFTSGKWVEYQIEAEKEISQLRMRYAAYTAATIKILDNGTEIALAEAEATGGISTWATLHIPVCLTEGQHTLRIYIQQGNIHVNWFKFD